MLLLAGGAQAQADPTTRSGYYAGLGAVYAIEAFSYTSDELGMASILGPGINPAYDSSAGIDVVMGYRFTPHIGGEFLYEWLEGFDSTRGTPDTEIDTHQLTFNAKLYPIGGRLQPFGLVGIGALIVNTEVVDPSVRKPFEVDLGFAARFGGGFDFYATDHFVIGFEASWLEGVGGLVESADQVLLATHFVWRF